MKKDKDKSKRNGESIIGKIIYGFLLFMPLLAIGVTCGYTMFNKNAYKSYSDYSSIQSNIITDNELVEEGTLITISYNGNTINDTTRFFIKNADSNIQSLFFTGSTWTIDSFSLLVSTGRSRLHVWDTNNNTYDIFNWQNINNDFYFRTAQNIQISNLSTYYYNLSFNTYVTNKLDNVFYYSVDKVTESNLFSWAKNSIIYTGISNTTTALSITSPFFPLLLTYWLIISLIYFLYDIILMLVIIIHKRIHALEDSL